MAALPVDASSGARTLAAIDLGSNSFHMVVARDVGGRPVIIDRLREHVRLAAGLTEDHRLSKSARRRGIESLRRFGQRIRELAADGVRAVATNTLRVARNGRSFLEEACDALGHPIEVISGREEARLIYLGVAHTLSDDELGCRLVLDIGGGSTECILGEQFEPLLVDSLEMGCVTWSRRFFPDGRIDPEAYDAAVTAARLEVRNVARHLRGQSWTSAVGSSGTMRSIEQALRGCSWAPDGYGIARDELRRLGRIVRAAKHVSNLDLADVKEERRSVFPGGVAIATALFKGLKLDRIATSPGALREGVLFDLLGRMHHEDVRDRTIRTFQERYHVDVDQAARVERTALALLRHVCADWQLDPVSSARFLSWTAKLHEIGLALSFEGHHRHAGYIAANADMPGFSRDDQELLAVLLATQRRKIRTAVFAPLDARRREVAERLMIVFRLAVRFHRGRGDSLPDLALRARPRGVELVLPDGWLDAHPMTRADLQVESARLKSVGLRLRIRA